MVRKYDIEINNRPDLVIYWSTRR